MWWPTDVRRLDHGNGPFYLPRLARIGADDVVENLVPMTTVDEFHLLSKTCTDVEKPEFRSEIGVNVINQSLVEEMRRLLLRFQAELPAYSHEFSPRKFTQPQLEVLTHLRNISELNRVDWPTETRPAVEQMRRLLEEIGERPECIKRLPVLSYRTVVKMLKDSRELRAALGLKFVPTYSTLCQYERRRKRSSSKPM